MGKGFVIFAGVCTVVSLILGIGGPFLIGALINSGVDS